MSVSQAKAFAKAAVAGTKKVVDDVSTEVKLARQYEGACYLSYLVYRVVGRDSLLSAPDQIWT